MFNSIAGSASQLSTFRSLVWIMFRFLWPGLREVCVRSDQLISSGHLPEEKEREMHSASRALSPFEVYGSIRTDRAKAEALETQRNDILGAGKDPCLESKSERERACSPRSGLKQLWPLFGRWENFKWAEYMPVLEKLLNYIQLLCNALEFLLLLVFGKCLSFWTHNSALNCHLEQLESQNKKSQKDFLQSHYCQQTEDTRFLHNMKKI